MAEKTKKTVPALRFRGFTDEWEEKKLKDLVAYNSTGIRTCDVVVDGLYDLYDANGVVGKVANYVHREAYISIIKDGSGVGRVRRLPAYTNCLGTMGCITANSQSKINFIFSLLEKKDFTSHIISGAIPHIYFSNYGEDEHLIPPTLPEQEKMGALFSVLDGLIRAKEEELEKLRQMKVALLEAMFPSGKDETSINFLGSNLINLLNSLPGGAGIELTEGGRLRPRLRFRGFADDWQEKRLGECGEFSKGRGYSKNDVSSSGTPLLLYGSLYTDYRISITSVDTYVNRVENALFSQGREVVVPASGETRDDIARASAIVLKGVIIGGDLNVVYPKKYLNPTFLALELSYGKSHCELVKRAQGVSVVHLRNSDMQDLLISLPTLAEQEQIGSFFLAQDEGIAGVEAQLAKLRTMKSALLERMFA